MIYLKLLRESFLFAFDALRVNLLRTLLSLLGITIGIFTIVSIWAGVDFMKNFLKDNTNKLGSNIIYVQKWAWSFGNEDYPWWKYYQRPQANLEDLKFLKEGLIHGEAVTLYCTIFNKTLTFGSNRVEDVTVEGVSFDADKTQTFEFQEGRYFLEGESLSGSPVCILGYEVAKGLFPYGDSPVGQQVNLFGRKVLVVGVFSKQGQDIFGLSTDKQVFIPYNLARLYTDVKNNNSNTQIRVKGPENLIFKEMESEVRTIMRNVRRLKPDQEDNFALNNPSIVAIGFQGIYETMDVVGLFIGFFSILIGMFGIANIMFVSVSERTSIIGIQKSLGAKNYFILLQFLVESIILCIIGGLIGILIAFGITSFLNKAFDIKMVISLTNITWALIYSVGIGIISGLWPAFRASRMDPVEAIRS